MTKVNHVYERKFNEQHYTSFFIRKSLQENEAQMVKILQKSSENNEAQFPTFSVFVGQTSIFCRCIQNVKDGI